MWWKWCICEVTVCNICREGCACRGVYVMYWACKVLCIGMLMCNGKQNAFLLFQKLQNHDKLEVRYKTCSFFDLIKKRFCTHCN